METSANNITASAGHIPWNHHRLIGAKPPLRLKEIWAIRTQLQQAHAVRELALFNLAIDSKLRGCDLVRLRVQDITQGGKAARRASVVQQKTKQPVRFELTDPTREAVDAWIAKGKLALDGCLFPSRLHGSDHISTRQYARIVKSWVKRIGLEPAVYGTHSLRRTKPTLIYRPPRISGPCSCSWATPSSRARCATSGSRSMMP